MQQNIGIFTSNEEKMDKYYKTILKDFPRGSYYILKKSKGEVLIGLIEGSIIHFMVLNNENIRQRRFTKVIIDKVLKDKINWNIICNDIIYVE